METALSMWTQERKGELLPKNLFFAPFTTVHKTSLLESVNYAGKSLCCSVLADILFDQFHMGLKDHNGRISVYQFMMQVRYYKWSSTTG